MSKKNSQSQNSSDKEIDFLEEEFLKCSPDDLPVPKEEIKIYNDEVLEVMKSGCNRQIAEHVMIKYKNLEDGEGKDKLNDLKNKYNITKIKFYEKIKTMLENKNDIKNNENKELSEYEEEINELCESNKDKDKNDIKLAIDKLVNEKDKDEEVKQFLEAREKYFRKREAVIEAALRKVKKIVNDKEEYKQFFKEYYGKEYVEDEEENKK